MRLSTKMPKFNKKVQSIARLKSSKLESIRQVGVSGLIKTD